MRNFWLINEIENTVKVNTLFSSLETIRFLKKASVADYGLKRKLVTLLTLLEVLRQIIYVVLGIGIGLALPLYGLREYFPDIEPGGAFVKLIIMFYFVLAGLTNGVFFEENYHRYFCIKRFHIDAGQYFIRQFIMARFWILTGEIMVILLAGFRWSSLYLLLPVAFCKEVFAAFGEMTGLLIYERGGLKLCKNIPLRYAGKIVILGVTAVWILLGRDHNPGPAQLYLAAGIAAVLGGIGLIYLLRYKNYLAICMDVDKASEFEIDYDDIQRKQDLAKVELHLNRHAGQNIHKDPFGYLNGLFFRRHKKIVYKNLYHNIAFCLIVALALAVMNRNEPLLIIDDQFIRNHFMGIFFILYICTNAKKVVRAMFFNCDSSMLRYHFYRSNRVMAVVYIKRSYMLSWSNVVNFLPFMLMIGGGGLVMGISPAIIIMLLIMIMLAAIAFSLFELICYYILQPFRVDTTSTRPLYALIQYLFPFVLLGFTQIPGSMPAICVMMAAATALLYGISVITVYAHGTRTFRIR